MAVEDEFTVTFLITVSKNSITYQKENGYEFKNIHALLDSEIRRYLHQEDRKEKEENDIWEGYAEDEKITAYEELEREA